MGERQIRHIGNVFGDNDAENRQPQNLLERKTSFNVFKNKQAPKPPQGQQALPRIGSYQPKILLEPKSANYNSEPRSEVSRSPERQNDVSDFNNAPKAMIIGDKNELLRIENDDSEDITETPIPAPRRKRRAPEIPEPEPARESSLYSNKPAFGRSVSERSDEERFDMDLEVQGGDIDFGPGIDNPAFNSRARSESSSSYRNSMGDRNEDRLRSQGDQKSYPYIPPPDYEDEEVTIDFDEEVEEFLEMRRNNTNNARVFNELEGEDFGKYLEDDYEFDVPARRAPRPPNQSQFGKVRQAPKPPKQQKYNKHPDNKKAAKQKKKQEKRETSMKRNTIRDFTFSDSKIGWGDRTVKSTSAKGRYIKREKDRKRIDNGGQFVQNGEPGSYEEFLRAKNGIPLESPNSSDSGVEMGEDSRTMEEMYMKNQPRQMREGSKYDKPTVWQRLTWRFKKSVTVTRQEPESFDYKF